MSANSSLNCWRWGTPQHINKLSKADGKGFDRETWSEITNLSLQKMILEFSKLMNAIFRTCGEPI